MKSITTQSTFGSNGCVGLRPCLPGPEIRWLTPPAVVLSGSALKWKDFKGGGSLRNILGDISQAEFPQNPFAAPFNQVLTAVGQKQAYETQMIKGFITNFRQLRGPLTEDDEVKAALSTLRRKMTEAGQ